MSEIMCKFTIFFNSTLGLSLDQWRQVSYTDLTNTKKTSNKYMYFDIFNNAVVNLISTT